MNTLWLSQQLTAGAAAGFGAQNELAILEFIHCFVEVLDKHFGQVCELDIMNEPDMVSSRAATVHTMA